jgi:hypothetical protein
MTPLVVLLVLLVPPVVVLAYRRTLPSLPTRARWILGGMRAVALWIVLLLVLDPRCSRRERIEQPATIQVLLDRSASMTLPDSGWDRSGPRRWDRALELLGRLRDRAERHGWRLEVRPFSSGLEETVEAAGWDTLRPDGQGTHLVAALRELVASGGLEGTTAVLCLTDGRETVGEEWTRRAFSSPVPVYAVPLGDPEPPVDWRILSVEAPVVVSVPARVRLRIRVEATGPPRETRLVVEGEEGEVARRTLRLGGDSTVTTVRIPLELREPGEWIYRVFLESPEGDWTAENDRRDVAILARRASVRVLLFDRHPGWESRFLAGWIEAHRDARVTWFASTPAGGEDLLPPRDLVPSLPEAELLILGATAPEGLPPGSGEAIARWLRDRGKGLLVLPGPGSLFEDRAGWEALRPILPVSAERTAPFRYRYVLVEPGPEMSSLSAFSGMEGLFGRTGWQERAPLVGVHEGVRALGGTVLRERFGGAPVLVTGQVGPGRVAVLSGGPLWRWRTMVSEGEPYDRLVGALVDWLLHGDPAGRFRLALPGRAYQWGAPVPFRAELFDRRLQPVTDRPVTLVVARVDTAGGEIPLLRVPMERPGEGSGGWHVQVRGLEPGRYRAWAVVREGERERRTDPVGFSVFPRSAEFQRITQDRSRLERLTRSTGGRTIPPGRFADFLDRVEWRPRKEQRLRRILLRSRPEVLALLVGWLSLEWLLRKRAGLL